MNIQTQAFNSKNKFGKIKKEQAVNLLESMYESASKEDKQVLARLYTHFIPAVPKKAKDTCEWVAKAVSTEAARIYLHHNYSDGKNLVATNGHAMHIAPASLEEGFYDHMGNKIELDYTFPDYKRVIPSYEKSQVVELNIEDFELVKENKDWAYIFTVEDTEFKVNKKYLENAINGEKEFTFEFTSKEEPYKITTKNGFGFAVVMGMK